MDYKLSTSAPTSTPSRKGFEKESRHLAILGEDLFSNHVSRGFQVSYRVDVTQLLYTSSSKLCAYELDNTAPQFVEPVLGISLLKTREAFN